MPSPTQRHWLEVEVIGEVAVGRFIKCRILHEQAVQQAGEQLLGLLEATGCHDVLLDLGRVEGMSTAFLGKLVALNRKVEDGGGRLALCRVNSLLLEVLELCRFSRLVSIYAEEQEALESF